MTIIVCVDDKGGVMFNHRRQSSDRVVSERILRLSKGSRLWMNRYSAGLFGEELPQEINVSDTFLEDAQVGEFAFVEGTPVHPYEEWIGCVIVFRWNRVYPADTRFDLTLPAPGWTLRSAEDFPGHSHERITMEVYEK